MLKVCAVMNVRYVATCVLTHTFCFQALTQTTSFPVTSHYSSLRATEKHIHWVRDVTRVWTMSWRGGNAPALRRLHGFIRNWPLLESDRVNSVYAAIKHNKTTRNSRGHKSFLKLVRHMHRILPVCIFSLVEVISNTRNEWFNDSDIINCITSCIFIYQRRNP